MGIIDYESLQERLSECSDAFAVAEPFPHIVLDDFLTPSAADSLLDEFDASDAWSHYNHYNERKMGLTRFEALGPKTQSIVQELSSQPFLNWLQSLSGIDGLLADPDLDGGGLHQIKSGGYLNVHADFQSHTTRPHWSRQINLLLYLNKDWEDSWDGFLELWDADVTQAVQRIKPAFNRCVIFHTTAASMHGHPTPLKCPEDIARKSLALYYFRDEGQIQKLTPTNYKARPEDNSAKHALVAADRFLVYGYSFLKRYTPLGDQTISRILKKFSR